VNGERRGVLTHSQAYPLIVELTDRKLNLSETPGDIQEPIGVSIGNLKFSCEEGTDFEEVEDELPSNDVLHRIALLSDVCWEIKTDGHDRRFVKVCVGKDVKDYRVQNDGSPGVLRPIAHSSPALNATAHVWGFEEWFSGPDVTVHVKYICGRSAGKQTTFKQSGSTYEIEIPTALACLSLNRHERFVVITTLPRLSMQSADRFWEYHFEFPNKASQEHIDRTGATRNEIYSLGNFTDGTFSIEADSSLDPDLVFLQNHLQIKITNGTMCPKHELPRQTIVRFRCPLDWIDLIDSGAVKGWTDHSIPFFSTEKKFKARLADVREPDICEYLFEVETTALCIDQEFIPLQYEIDPSTLVCSTFTR
jgi:hypothetical protein